MRFSLKGAMYYCMDNYTLWIVFFGFCFWVSTVIILIGSFVAFKMFVPVDVVVRIVMVAILLSSPLFQALWVTRKQ